MLKILKLPVLQILKECSWLTTFILLPLFRKTLLKITADKLVCVNLTKTTTILREKSVMWPQKSLKNTTDIPQSHHDFSL